MIEILVGLGIITSVLVVSLVVVTHSVRLATAARNKLEATKYAEKVLESLRNTRDLNKETFFANETCSANCGTFGLNNMYGCTLSCSFLPPGAATRVDATVTMTWTDAGNPVSISLPTVLTKYDL